MAETAARRPAPSPPGPAACVGLRSRRRGRSTHAQPATDIPALLEQRHFSLVATTRAECRVAHYAPLYEPGDTRHGERYCAGETACCGYLTWQSSPPGSTAS